MKGACVGVLSIITFNLFFRNNGHFFIYTFLTYKYYPTKE